MVLAVRKKVQIWGLAIKSYLQQWEGEKKNKLFHITDLPPTPKPNTSLPSQKKRTQLIHKLEVWTWVRHL